MPRTSCWLAGTDAFADCFSAVNRGDTKKKKGNKALRAFNEMKTMVTDSSSDEMCCALVNAPPAAALLVTSRWTCRLVAPRCVFCRRLLKSKLNWNVVTHSRQCKLSDVAAARDGPTNPRQSGWLVSQICSVYFKCPCDKEPVESVSKRGDVTEEMDECNLKKWNIKNLAVLQKCGPASLLVSSQSHKT